MRVNHRLSRDPFGSVIIILILAGVCLLLGAATGCRTGAPTAIEEAWFDVTTNRVPVVTLATNQVVDPVTGQPSPVVTAVTNVVEEYEFAPNERAQATTQGAANIANLLMPGSGSLVGLVAGGLAALYAQVRSAKSRKVAAGVIQGLETLRAVLRQTPQGQEADRELVKWLMRHQMEAGILNEVATLIRKTVKNADADRIASQIMALVDRQMPPKTAA